MPLAILCLSLRVTLRFPFQFSPGKSEAQFYRIQRWFYIISLQHT